MIDRAILECFSPISLEEMGKVKLMNRIDTKYVAPFDRIVELLRIASSHYLIQEIEGRRNMPYYTRYYDTPDAEMYYQHHRGKKNRQKVRVRHYEESGLHPFMEIKTKNNKGRTFKKRISMDNGADIFAYREFLLKYTSFEPSCLTPQIENHFYRITLTDREMTERITIDTRLEFHNIVTDTRLSLDNIGIIEWKRDGRNCRSELDKLLNRLRIHRCGFSKYCVGMAITNPDLRQNRLKQRLRMIDKLQLSTLT